MTETRNYSPLACSYNFGRYTEATSEWTLDYPPFFAWFEKLLSLGAAYVDPQMLEVNNLDYETPAVVMYQRSTVIASEMLLLWIVWLSTKYDDERSGFGPAALKYFCITIDAPCRGHQSLRSCLPFRGCKPSTRRLTFGLVALHPGLLIVDHIHFQYNGILLGKHKASLVVCVLLLDMHAPFVHH